MIISEKSITKWNSRTKKYFTSLGYEYTKMGDEFEVEVCHLQENAQSEIVIKCDYCGELFVNTLRNRNKAFKQNTTNKKDICKKQECLEDKIKETNLIKYGNEYAIASNQVREKITTTFKNKYEVENPFQLEEVKSKIKSTNLSKYGNESFVRTEIYKEKTESTNMEKYGVKVASQSDVVRGKLKGKTAGEKHYNWKGGISKENTLLRQTSEYKNWRKAVYERDNYTCQCCKTKGGKLNAHHIENFSDNENKRHDIDNGIALCVKCHSDFHNVHGRKNNNRNQLESFIINYG